MRRPSQTLAARAVGVSFARALVSRRMVDDLGGNDFDSPVDGALIDAHRKWLGQQLLQPGTPGTQHGDLNC